MNFIVKRCKRCGKQRKFLVGSEREMAWICGECWDWTKNNRKI